MSWTEREIPEAREIAPSKPTVFCKVEVRPKADGQHGIFALEPLAADQIVFRDGGVVVPMSLPAFPKYGYAVVIDEGLMLAPRDYENLEPMQFLNHSCEPNIARIGGLVYRTKRKVELGEELLIHYSPLLAGYHDDWTLVCECKSSECIGQITSHDWKNPALARELWAEWLPFIQRRILKEVPK